MEVSPTPKFAFRTVQVPGLGPVHRPAAVKPFDVPDHLVPWLLENGYVQAVDGEIPKPSADPVALEAPVSEAAPEPEQPSDDAAEDTEPLSDADALSDEETVDLLIALDKLSPQEIADAIDGVGLTTAKKLKRSPLTEFEQLDSALNKAQLAAVVAWFRALPQ